MNATALPARTEVAIVGRRPDRARARGHAGLRRRSSSSSLTGWPRAPNTSRAAVVHARTLEVLDELDASKELIDRGIPVTRFAVRDGSRRLLTVPFDGLPTPYPYTLMVPQYETEDVLLGRLRALGGDVHRPYEVSSVVQDEDGVTLTMSTGETLRAGYAVGADGMHSAVREASGIGFTGSAYGESFVLADVEMDWAPGQQRGVSHLRRRRSRRRRPARPAGTTGSSPPWTTPRRPPTSASSSGCWTSAPRARPRSPALAWSSRFRVHHRVADHYRNGRLLLAGDAAHVHSPAGGQGMNTGIQDGYALGRAFATGQLDGYEAQRRPVAQRVVAFTDRMTKMATTRSPVVRGVRNTALPLLGRVPAFRTKLATELAELNYR